MNKMIHALTPYLPVTVIGAIILFMIREALEFRRRRNADQRKLKAIKNFIARDLELCIWAIHTYRNVLGVFERIEEESGRKIRMFSEPSGRLRYEHWGLDDVDAEFRSGAMVAPVVNTFASRFMLDIATLDKQLYDQVERTTDSIAELEHIKSSLMEQAMYPIHNLGFVEYARLEINDIEKSIAELYLICTGTAKIRSRIR